MQCFEPSLHFLNTEHALIGIGEALVTPILVNTFSCIFATSDQWKFAAPLLGALLTTTI